MNPFLLGLYAWRETTTLSVRLRKISAQAGETAMNLKGKLHISLPQLLRSACTLKGSGRFKLVYLLTRSLLRTYIFQVPRTSHISFASSDLARWPYPSSTIHEIKTGEIAYSLFLFMFSYNHH